MDYQSFEQQKNNRRSQRLEMLSLVMGIIALSTACLVYTSLICGALGIVFALLSRGGEMTFSPRAKLGLTLSSIGLGLVIILMIYTLVVAELYYGGLENMVRETYQMMGLDYESLLQN